MARSKPMTAKEFVAKLAGDPEYQARLAQEEREQAAAWALIRADERLLVAEIRKVGYAIESVSDLVNSSPHPFLPRNFIGPYPRAYPILVRHLSVAHQSTVRESIIRALTVKDGGQLVKEALIREFDGERDRILRWVLANAIRYAVPYSERRKRRDIVEAWRNPSGA